MAMPELTREQKAALVVLRMLRTERKFCFILPAGRLFGW